MEGTRKLAGLSLASLGVVYGDIGTSPLYAFRECFVGEEGLQATPANVLGVLSLIVWSLILVISIKYLVFILKADNDGEGGILALMELVQRTVKGRQRKFILIIGLFGAALLYGDGTITPAISVLSAIEGLNVATPVFSSYVIPITIVILVGLFSIQRLGTGKVGRLFGPLMLVWFSVLAVGGLYGIIREPGVLAAVSPHHAIAFFVDHGLGGLAILGIVFLVVTGGEALYADIGHFGKAPMRLGWYLVALPGLLLNYLGQGALLLSSKTEITNPFYQLTPEWSLYPMVVLSTVATVIASQAIISGIFSLTYQGMHLGYLPRIEIRHTSHEQRGQIYVPLVNWVLMAATIGLVIGFRESGNLAGAYGVAIAMTMVITTVLFAYAGHKVLEWPLWTVALLTFGFLLVDLPFLAANMAKFLDGGWFPLVVAGGIYLFINIWRRGYASERRKSRNQDLTIRDFLARIGGGGTYRRVPGQAVYLAGNARGTPQVLERNIRFNRGLHDKVVIYTAVNIKAPRAKAGQHLKVKRLRDDLIRVVSYNGYMEAADVQRDLAEANETNQLGLDLDKVVYFVGNKIHQVNKSYGLSGWESWLYTIMARNEMRATRYFNLPREQVMEIGTRIDI